MMNIQDYKNTWVVVETVDGVVKNASLELINQGKAIANSEKTVAVVIGQNVDEAVKTVAAYGADEVLVVEGEEYKNYSTDAFANAVVTLVEKYKPSVLLTAATKNGRDLTSRVAGKLQVGSAADCTAVEILEGTVTFTRPIYSGNLLSAVSFPETRPQVASIRPGTYEKGEADASRTAEVINEAIPTPADQIRTKVLDIIKSVSEGIKLEEAEIVVAGGRGLGKAENVQLMEELAAAIGGAVGGTRACIDAGWMPPQLQIGQSGKRVSPKLYIGCGISGAIQHIGGMSSSDVIIAINKDPEAPIFEIADYGVVGDLFEVVPVLIDEIKKRKLVTA
jgi:electron transfer flavoprotein alpha subunit